MAQIRDPYTYFQSHILPVYKRAMVWDDNLCVFMLCEFGSMYSFKDASSRLYIAGSCYEGACSPRMYWIPPVIEMDILHLSENDKRFYYGEPHPDKVGVFVLTNITRQSRYESYNLILHDPPSASSPKYIKQAYRNNDELVKKHPQYYPEWKSKLFDRPHGRTSSGKGPSLKANRTMYGTCLQEDSVYGWFHHGWPQEAMEWKTRKRHWPPQSLVEEVTNQGYQMLLKLADSADGKDIQMESHITFTLSERLLAKKRTPVQRLVYLMAKTLFYTYLDLQDDNNPNIEFPSYALKTCMMYLMEQTPVDSWTQDNIPHMLRALFMRLELGVVHGCLEHYFIACANVLQNCTPALLKKAKGHLCSILSNMDKYLQGTKLYEGNVLLYGYYVLQGGEEAYNDVVNGCQNQVIDGVLKLLDKVHRVRSIYMRITKVLKHGKWDGPYKGSSQFDEEECIHLLKAMMNINSYDYMKNNYDDTLNKSVHYILARYMWSIDDLIEYVLCLDKNLPEPQVALARWQGEGEQGVRPIVVFGNRSILEKEEIKDKIIHKLVKLRPGETDIIIAIQGHHVDMCRFTSIGDFLDAHIRDLHDKEADKWMPQIYSLTHKEIPELQLMDFARMLYLMFYLPEVKQGQHKSDNKSLACIHKM